MALKKSSRIALQALKNDFIQMFVAERMGEERPPRVRDHLFISRSHSQISARLSSSTREWENAGFGSEGPGQSGTADKTRIPE